MSVSRIRNGERRVLIAQAPPSGKLAVLLSSLRGGGAERQLLRLSAELAHLGWDLDLVIVNRRESAYTVPAGVHAVDLRASRVRYAVPPLLRYLRRAKPAVMYSAETPVNLLAILGRMVAHYPRRLVVSERNHLSSVARHSTRVADRARPNLARWLYPKADLVVAVSQAVAEDLVHAAKLSGDRVRVVNNMFDISEIGRESLRLSDGERRTGGQPPLIMSIGRLVPQKDHTTLLKAFAIMRVIRPCKLVILGEGPERSRLEDLALQLGIADEVSLPGFSANPFAHLAKASVFVLPSAWEGLPGALIEAMACGTPVVATDCPGGSAEILQGGQLGMLVPVGDVDALAAAIRETLRQPSAPSRLRRRAQDFDIEAILPQFMAILRPDAPSPTRAR